jgi:hypothetical protein
MTKKDSSDDQLSDVAAELVKRAVIYADEHSFEDGMSEDMKYVLVAIVNRLVDNIIATYQPLFEGFSDDEMSQFKNPFYEAIGFGYKLYWTEKKYILNEDNFVKFKGEKFQNYLLREYEAYFANLTKDPEPLTPPYVQEAIMHFGLSFFRYGYIEGNKIELIKKLGQVDDNFFKQVNILGLLQASIWNGYMLCVSQDEYRELVGINHKKSRAV